MVKNKIALLSKETIDQIAAGEVVERPVSVVKELVENAIDAGADAITVEIKDGGKSLIRVTDNGCGIEKDQLQIAFMRHATSKLRTAEELLEIHSLGFRGEALSSIGAVSRVEMITKTADEMMGCRYIIEGSEERSLEEVGAPDGTTIMVYHLFYNTPARQKFLKSDKTEGSYIAELMERLALSHPEISFCFIQDKKEKLHTAGNGQLFDAIYQIYGKQIADNVLPIKVENESYRVEGFIGNTLVARGNRNLESMFINGRYVKSPLLSRALEEGYVGFLMLHQYPFCVLSVETKGRTVDVNVHPTKQEVRFDNEEVIAAMFTSLVQEALTRKEDISEVTVDNKEIVANIAENVVDTEGEENVAPMERTVERRVERVEPFEKNKLREMREKITAEIHKDTPYERKYKDFYAKMETDSVAIDATPEVVKEYVQTSFLSEEAKKSHRVIGQLFDTYWMVEYDAKLYIIDQHAAHEKVLYEHMMDQLKKKTMTSQLISPPIVISLSSAEKDALDAYQEYFVEIGFQIASFGGNEIAISGVPGNLYSIDVKQLFLDMLSECMTQKNSKKSDLILEKIASMSCKAAVKGNQKLSRPEVEELIDELLTLENPYHCPHGRPTIISMTKYELEKKFKRIV